MASGAEKEREADVKRLDEAIELLLESMRVAVKVTDDPVLDELNAVVYAKRRAELAKSLPALFERRSKLLGLDATPGATDTTEKPSAAVQRILSAVPGGAGK